MIEISLNSGSLVAWMGAFVAAISAFFTYSQQTYVKKRSAAKVYPLIEVIENYEEWGVAFQLKNTGLHDAKSIFLNLDSIVQINGNDKNSNTENYYCFLESQSKIPEQLILGIPLTGETYIKVSLKFSDVVTDEVKDIVICLKYWREGDSWYCLPLDENVFVTRWCSSGK